MRESSRQSKVSELVKRELAKILQSHIFNSHSILKIPFYLTVTEVQISKDLKNSTVFVHPFFPTNQKISDDDILKIISSESYKLRKNLGSLNLRFLPKIKFKIDKLLEENRKIDELFSSPRISQDLQ